MYLIRTAEDMACALDSPIDPQLKAVLRAHVERLQSYGPLEDLALFVITETGDTITDIEVSCGVALVGGGVAEFATSPEYVVQHVGWFEVVFILSDDGFGLVLLVQNGNRTDPRLLTACRAALEQQDIQPGEEI